ncbi:hypothetical protein [Pseudomonas fluorescens]|uniref:Uncharacterized protein n=1 Tax=Pseudomonas fluorescens TaxID=294 RepID=A0A5E7CAQ7_PSEFL|nr:hypothetical protein [Pseudomonas fluorescens]VVN99517.1 hypothetical protein PS691_02515 [Pseudomonas fluorescens]
MHKTRFIKSTLLLILLNGASAFSAQAASLAYDSSCMSNSGKKSGAQLGMLIEEHAGGALFTLKNSLGVPLSISDIYFDSDDGQPALFSSIAYHSDSGVGVSFDSQAALANLPGVGPHVQGIGLAGTADSYIKQQSAVPLPAAAWLFSSALFGFIVFANRRKV